jgi:hypothetical protein
MIHSCVKVRFWATLELPAFWRELLDAEWTLSIRMTWLVSASF